MKSMKKTFALLMAAALLLTLCLSGCGGSPASASTPAFSPAPAPSSTPASEPAAPEVEEITFWHYLTDRADFLERMATEWEAQTGIHVNLQMYGGDTYDQKVQAAIQGKALPNIWVFSGGKGVLSDFAENGYISELSDQADYLANFDETAMGQLTFNTDEPYAMTSGVYGLPLDMNNMMIIYNKAMFKEAGVDTEKPFETWEEFMTACQKLKDKGYAPFTSGLGSWCQYQWTEQYQFAYSDVETINKMREGEITFEEGNLTPVFEMVQEMCEKEYFMANTGTIDLPTAESYFANNEVAMLYDGSWVVNVLAGLIENMDPNAFGVAICPKAPGTDKYPGIQGGVGAYMVVSGQQSDAERAASIDFLKFMTNKENQIAYANESSNIPVNKQALDISSLNPLLAGFYSGMEYLAPSVAAYNPSTMSVNYSNEVQALVIGQTTAADAVAQLDADRASLS